MKHGSNTDQREEVFVATNCGDAAFMSLESLTAVTLWAGLNGIPGGDHVCFFSEF